MNSFLNDKRVAMVLAGMALVCASGIALRGAPPDEPAKEAVGVIEGEGISVQGPMSVSVVEGKVQTLLRSGGDVRVKSGRATLQLVEGGKIAICGPAHFSVLKSGGALTVALDSGAIHTWVEQEPALTIYTALLQAKPIAIGGAPQDTVLGLDANGALTVRAIGGAVRIEQQLTGQSIVVPQNSNVLLSDGQLNGMKPGEGHGYCELGEVKSQQAAMEVLQPMTQPVAQPASQPAAQTPGQPTTPAAVQNMAQTPTPPVAAVSSPPTSVPAEQPSVAVPQVSVPATAEATKKPELKDSKPNLPAANKQAPPGDGPVYQVYLPPMRYDANLKVQQPPDPSLIVLVRRVRVRPTLIFEGSVEGETIVAENHPPAPPAPQPKATEPATTGKPVGPAANTGVIDRVKTFFKNLWGSKS